MNVQRGQGLWDVYSRKIDKKQFFFVYGSCFQVFHRQGQGTGICHLKTGSSRGPPQQIRIRELHILNWLGNNSWLGMGMWQKFFLMVKKKELTDTCVPVFIAALFPIVKGLNNPSVHQSKNRLQNVVDTHNMILFSHKKEWNLGICYNMMNPENMMLSEISQTEEDKYCMASPIWGT